MKNVIQFTVLTSVKIMDNSLKTCLIIVVVCQNAANHAMMAMHKMDVLAVLFLDLN